MQEADTASQEGRELIKEVWEVVAQKYVDARGPGFDQQHWSELRDAALSKPLHDKAATYRYNLPSQTLKDYIAPKDGRIGSCKVKESHIAIYHHPLCLSSVMRASGSVEGAHIDYCVD